MARLQFPSYLSKILVDSLQAANARDYCMLFFQILVFVEPIVCKFREVSWEEKPSAYLFDLQVQHNIWVAIF
jgi:hypothetical protein